MNTYLLGYTIGYQIACGYSLKSCSKFSNLVFQMEGCKTASGSPNICGIMDFTFDAGSNPLSMQDTVNKIESIADSIGLLRMK